MNLACACIPFLSLFSWGENAYQHEIEGNNAFACTFCHFIFRANITKSVFSDKNTWIWQIQFFSPLVLLGKHMLYANCLSSHTKLLPVKTVLYKMVQHNNKTFDLLHFSVHLSFWSFALGSFSRSESLWPFIVSFGHILIWCFLSH